MVNKSLPKELLPKTTKLLLPAKSLKIKALAKPTALPSSMVSQVKQLPKVSPKPLKPFMVTQSEVLPKTTKLSAKLMPPALIPSRPLVVKAEIAKTEDFKENLCIIHDSKAVGSFANGRRQRCKARSGLQGWRPVAFGELGEFRVFEELG